MIRIEAYTTTRLPVTVPAYRVVKLLNGRRITLGAYVTRPTRSPAVCLRLAVARAERARLSEGTA